MFLSLVLFSQFMVAKLVAPPQGAYQGAYVDAGPMANVVSIEKIKAFEALSGKKLVWVYFANDWLDGVIEFPIVNVKACETAGVIPYIRLMPWTESKTQATAKDPNFSMEQFLAGDHDEALKAYAQAAKATGLEMILEFGPEANGDWFPWNGKWNGGGKKNRYGSSDWPDGPERFRDVYRRIIDIFRAEGANNVTWVFHVDTAWLPRTSWNEAHYYYPGDEYIDWIGLSVFGAQLPSHDWLLFLPKFSDFQDQLDKVSLVKPVMISEFAAIENPNIKDYKANWIQHTFEAVELGIFPRIKGVSYWNSTGWLPDGAATFEIDSSPQALKAYQNGLSSDFWLEKGIFE